MMQYAEKLWFSKNQAGRVLITVGVQVWRYKFILERSTPVSHPTVNAPPPSSGYVNAKVRWLWMAVKSISISIYYLVFSKLVLDDVKVNIL